MLGPERLQIHHFIWAAERVEHIAAHAVDTGEVEEVCFGSPMVLRAKSEGLNPVYYCLGQTPVGAIFFAS